MQETCIGKRSRGEFLFRNPNAVVAARARENADLVKERELLQLLLLPCFERR
ncbi:hypothetical protein [Arthrobacter methylotrophus]|uniref:hypothetical protein n=1 Tax=Arthrobacter methylotrophus TaxID=121291 RepID=UPI0031EBF3FC